MLCFEVYSVTIIRGYTPLPKHKLKKTQEIGQCIWIKAPLCPLKAPHPTHVRLLLKKKKQNKTKRASYNCALKYDPEEQTCSGHSSEEHQEKL